MTEHKQEAEESSDNIPDVLSPALRDAGRRLSAHRRIVSGHCSVCGKPFEGTRKRRYCSHSCTQTAYMRRKQQEGDKEP